MMRVSAMFLDATGKGHALPPFEATKASDIHLRVFEALVEPEHATWSFVLAIQLVNPPQIITDRASFNRWEPTPQQHQALLDQVETQELERLQASQRR